jgi:hypothetical protein
MMKCQTKVMLGEHPNLSLNLTDQVHEAYITLLKFNNDGKNNRRLIWTLKKAKAFQEGDS